jgi:DNA-binding CsgD family transcriptional regulator
MTALTHADSSALLDFLQQCYEMRDLCAFRKHIVSAIQTLVPSEITTYNEIDPQTQRVSWVEHPVNVLNFPDSQNIFAQHVAEHPLVNNYARTGDDRVLKISDFLSLTRLRKLALYQDFYRRVGVEDQMVIVLPALKPLIIAIALNRNKRTFTERERLLLSLLRPHLVAAYKNAKAVTAMADELATTRKALTQSGTAFILLSQDRMVRSTSPEARKLLVEYFDMSRATDGIPDELRRWTKQYYETLEHFRVIAPLVVNRKEEQLTIRMVRESDGFLLLLTERHTAIRAHTLEDLALTPREVEVLSWVAQGKTNSDIAAILSVSSRTVQKHLEHIFDKLAVDSRTAAAGRAWEAMKGSVALS